MLVILETKSGQVVETIDVENSILLNLPETKYPVLSALSDCAYDCFGPPDMSRLLAELETRRDEENSMEVVTRIHEIMSLAKRCERSFWLILTFTPFGK